MSAQRREKVGVVVIHGVGETYEGWIDSYLVPELEKWRAHENVKLRPGEPVKEGARKRKDNAGKDENEDTEIAGKDEDEEKGGGVELRNKWVFVARTADGRHIALSLFNDNDFFHFAKVIGLDREREFPIFLSSALRLKYRDRLLRHIFRAIATKPADEWLAIFHKPEVRVPSALAFDPASEVRRVRDPESSDPARTWASFTRRWPLDGRDVIVSELFWADMSRVGTTTFSRLGALVELCLESPFILGRAFLAGCNKGIHGVIRTLLGMAGWLMRWPIAGISVSMFMAAVAVGIVQLFGWVDWVPETIAASLLVSSAIGYQAFRRLAHRRLGLADLALATFVFALVLLAALAVSAFFLEGLPRPVAPYLTTGISVALAIWALWTALMTLAIILLGLVALKRILFWPFVRGKKVSPPLARPAAATALGVILGALWKTVLGIFGFAAAGTLVPEVRQAVACSPSTWLDGDRLLGTCPLGYTRSVLFDAILVNGAALVLILLAALAVVGVRNGIKRIYGERAKAGRLLLPRLIASPFLVVAILAGALIAAAWIARVAAEIYAGEGPHPLTAYLPFPQWVWESWGLAAAAFIIFVIILYNVVELSDPIIHIGRDLVDHQYRADLNSMAARLLLPSAGKAKKTDEGNPLEDEDNPDAAAFKRFRRRLRIQRRLEALIHDVIAGYPVDRVIFVGHSQGTVILYDYLSHHDNLVSERRSVEKTLRPGENAMTIDVVTVGSPLKHLYRYYFRDYDWPEKDEQIRLTRSVTSWTNISRVDDPIGADVLFESATDPKGDERDLRKLVENHGIGPGGHITYWKANEVCETIWALMNADGGSAPPR